MHEAQLVDTASSSFFFSLPLPQSKHTLSQFASIKNITLGYVREFHFGGKGKGNECFGSPFPYLRVLKL